MAIPVNHVIEVALHSLFLGKEAINRYHYVGGDEAGETVTIEAVATAWWDIFQEFYAQMTVSDINRVWFQNVEVKDLSDKLGDLGRWAIPSLQATGSRSSSLELLPRSVSMSLELNVDSRVTRPGGKRLFGHTETDQINNNWTVEALQYGLSFETPILTPLVVPSTGTVATFIPSILRAADLVNPTFGIASQPIQSVSVKAPTRTQTTRRG